MDQPGEKEGQDRQFEQGPIRPPSEAGSLLLRVSRNCPWSRCAFCPLYKGQSFSVRSAQEVVADIDAVARQLQALQQQEQRGPLSMDRLRQWHRELPMAEQGPFRAAVHWRQHGLRSVFLQDADALAAGAAELITVLKHLRRTFPQVERVTCYSRSSTVARCAPAELQDICRAGLNRLHMGLESGCDEVLRAVCKGASQALHIRAGQMVRAAGIELSLYVMPGLGGLALSAEHARQTAAALSQINPQFIRLRTLAVPPGSPLEGELRAGRFEPCSAVETTEEIRLFIESLEGIDSMLVSDHALNLFEDLQGRLPGDKAQLLETLSAFLSLDKERQTLYQLGRRAGMFRGLSDMEDAARLAEVELLQQQLGVTPDNVEEICAELMKRFI